MLTIIGLFVERKFWSAANVKIISKVLFIESICDDKEVLESNMRLKLSGPDYKNVDPEEALDDFRRRVANYERAYETIGKKIIAHNIKGYLSGQCIFYLMNLNLFDRQIWLTRHGESADNVSGRIGGDSSLSEKGRKFAACLSRFVHAQKMLFRQKQLENYSEKIGSSTPPPEPPERNFLVWTSMLKRTIETVESLDPKEFDIMHIRFLNEIYAGRCEGKTYQEIEQSYPEEFNARKNNKLYYRYPGMGGESYLDVIHRVNPLIIEPSILAALIKLFEAPTEIKKSEEEELISYDFEEERQFQSAFARLTSTGKLKRDPTERIEDPKIFLAHSLQTLSQRYPGKINDMISTKLPPECTHHLVQYMSLANPSGCV
ncbi:unnamed protein product [Rhizophagus irregularis]|nr:unnamed protein product [Rhizophagus irregularis]